MTITALFLVLGCGGSNSTVPIDGASGGASGKQCVLDNCNSSTTWRSVSAGSGAACAIAAADNIVVCWGFNIWRTEYRFQFRKRGTG